VDVALETEHVGRARHAPLAGQLVGNIVGEEGLEGSVDEAVEALFPYGAAVGLWGCPMLAARRVGWLGMCKQGKLT
jgi:hypothetical protein